MPSLHVAHDSGGIRLQDFLERELPRVRRPALRRLLASGGVAVNRMTARPGQRLRGGDLVEWAELGREAWLPERPRELPPVLHEDGSFLVLDKPAGLYTVPDRHGRDPGLYGLMQEARPGQDLRIAHRLDRETSGCIVLAKGLAAARHLDAAFRAGRVRKEYAALVHGEVRRERIVVDRPLGPDPRRPGKVRVETGSRRRARSACTEVEVTEHFTGHTSVRLLPRTGRGHQLRVHMSHLGHPIVGDADYGGSPLLLSRIKRGYKGKRGVPERPLVDRMFLHAGRLVIPVTGGELAIEAPMPRELCQALEKLRRFAGIRLEDSKCN